MGELTIENHKQLWQMLADEWNVKEIVLDTPISTQEGDMSVVYNAKSWTNKEPNFKYRFKKDNTTSDVDPLSEETLLKVLENLRKDLVSQYEKQM